MNNRHLPTAPGPQGIDMDPAAGNTGHSHGPNGPRRPRPHSYHAHHSHQGSHNGHNHFNQHAPQHVNQAMYNYVNSPYSGYYPAMSGQYAGANFVPYNPYSARNPPATVTSGPHYVPMPGVMPYSRPPQLSPTSSSPYHPSPPPTISSTSSATLVASTPLVVGPAASTASAPPPVSSTPSSQSYPGSPPTDVPQIPEGSASSTAGAEVTSRIAFHPPLPWLSVPEAPFPPRPKSRRRRRLVPSSEAVELPGTNQELPVKTAPASSQRIPIAGALSSSRASTNETPTATGHEHFHTEPPSTSAKADAQPTASMPLGDPPKQPMSLVAAVPAVSIMSKTSLIASPKANRNASRSASPKSVKSSVTEKASEDQHSASSQASPEKPEGRSEAGSTTQDVIVPTPDAEETPKPPPVKTTWAGLFANTSAAKASTAAAAAYQRANGNDAVRTFDGNGISPTGTPLAKALASFRIGGGLAVFLEPRGLVNTGNMCYTNSILQVLVFCAPFYDFLDGVSKRVAHSFRSETPLIDAMISFVREFKVLKVAPTPEQLQKLLKPEILEQYGDAFTPEFVYDAIRKHPRFSNMRRGHQQDAEEFLGFLLQSLHDECAKIQTNGAGPSPNTASKASQGANSELDDWLEVGPKQKPAVTRSSGHPQVSSPLNKIFGGQLRTELRKPGQKMTVMFEPYQPLQLDISSPQVRNIVDALSALTRPETIQDAGRSMQQKQVFVESLPPVLILHLKRFQYHGEEKGTVKVWKKVGYPLELDFPREVLSRQARTATVGPPRFRLTGVVYHHGKNASGGHYTADLLRQDGVEWIRFDDTTIRRVRREDVAEGGAEEDPSKSDPSRRSTPPLGATRSGVSDDSSTAADEGWKAVNGSRKWSSVVNGAPSASASNPKPPLQAKDNARDNKVAYLLFYRRF